MPEKTNQQPVNNKPEMTADETAAALSFATMISEQMIPKDIQETPQEAQNAPGQEELSQPDQNAVQDETNAKMVDLEAKFKDIPTKDEIEVMIKKEVSSIKESISEALNE